MIFEAVPFHTIAEEVARKSRDYELEISENGPVNLDWDYYLEASHAGQCIAIIVRDKGEFLGGSVFFITTNANHKHLLEAVNSVIFLDKKARGKTAIRLFKKSHEFLKSLGVHEINYTLKNDRIGKLLARQGFKPSHTVWSIKA